MSSAFDNKIASPALSPSLNEFGESLITDENSKQLELVAVVQIDASGHSNMGSAVYANGHTSQVTAKQQGAVVTAPGGEKMRLRALVSLDSNGNPVPFSLKAKFQSAVETGTGSAQNIAHGLGVVPSLVLVSAQGNDGLSTWSIVEGSHTSTNLVVTATSGLPYKVIALA